MSDEAPLASLAHEEGEFRAAPGGLEWTGRQETLRIEAWGADALRVRSRVGGPILADLPGALAAETAPPLDAEPTIVIGAYEAFDMRQAGWTKVELVPAS